MRQIPTEVLTLLKSRSMIGANKPSNKVTVEGLVSGEYKWNETTVWHRPSTTYAGNNLSVAKKINGKLIVCNIYNNIIYEGECDSVADLVSADNSASGWKSAGITTYGTVYATVYNLGADLYMTVCQFGVTDTYPTKTEIYKSPSGNGGDWILYSTVASVMNGSWGMSGGFSGAGVPVILSTGRWVMNCLDVGTYNGPHFLACTSDDGGINWIFHKPTFWPYDYYASVNKKIYVSPSGNLYSTMSDYYGNSELYIARSTDAGVTWATYGWFDGSIFTAGFETPNFSLIDNKKNGFYVFAFCGSVNKVWEFANPDADINAYTEIATLPSFDAGAVSYCVTEINNSLIFMRSNYVLGIEAINAILPTKSIGINRNKNMAGSLNLSLDNKNGEWSPDNTVHQNVLFPNSEITVKQGYGTNLIQTFKGLIDRIEMSTFPQELKLSVRDKLKLALDQTITFTDGVTHVILFQNQTVEAIFTTLCGYAGLTTGTIEATGLTLAEKTFSWESYADCFSWLADLVGFEYGANEEGSIYFKKDAIPQATDWILTFTSGTAQAYAPIVESSEALKTSDGLTTYVKDTDYTIDYETGVITSITIPDGQTLMSYVFAAYTFKEGVDIVSLGYSIDDNDLYASVVVYGKDPNDAVISASKDYVSKDYYKVLPQKILKIDASDADTVEKCQTIADRAEMLMRSRVREVSFASIAVPWLQVGDLIKVVESSTTISEIYRITDLSTTQDTNGYTMQLTCYHHSA